MTVRAGSIVMGALNVLRGVGAVAVVFGCRLVCAPDVSEHARRKRDTSAIPAVEGFVAASYFVIDHYEFSSDPTRLDAALVHHWLSTDAYWALGRSRDTQDRAIAGSLNFGVYEPASGSRVAYARIVTDHVTFAWLCDVYVDHNVRGKGLGTALVTVVRDHLEPYGLRRVLLVTSDAHEIYEKVGFQSLEVPGKWMVYGRQ